MKTITTDVVVIGGGAAGCYATLGLLKKGLRVVMICKGLIGKSGASIFAGNLVLSGRLLGNTEEQASSTAEFLIKYHNQFLIDQKWAKRCADWIQDYYYPELEEIGLYFRRNDDGEVVTNPGKIRSVAANVQGNSGVPFMDLRRKQIIRSGVERYEEAVVTALLKRGDGSIGGVFALNYMTGESFVVQARATVLATGYSDRLHRRSTGTRELSADGIAMAWRAGASMVNLEMQWWHTNDVAQPPTWQRVQIYPNPILGSLQSARMVNSVGEEFFDQQKDDPMAFGPYTVQLKALYRQVHAGKARYDGGYFSGFDHIDKKEIDAYTTYSKAYKQLGMSGSDNLLETAVTAHYRQGGLLVDNSTMKSTVPGLYVAGGVGGHSNGLIALATYDGKVVADSVAADFETLSSEPVPPSAAGMEEKRIMSLLKSDGSKGCGPGEIKRQIQECMWNHVGVEKSATGLNLALEHLAHIRQDAIPTMQLRQSGALANYEWLDAIDVINMLDAAELIILASLQRQESRGPFMRTDYPDTDNKNWLAANIMHRTQSGIRFERIPYELPTFQPGFERKPNLEVSW